MIITELWWAVVGPHPQPVSHNEKQKTDLWF